jgi:epoxide hydrolase-like predicted phosphatase
MNPRIKTIIFDCFGVVFDPVLGGWYKDNMLKRGLVDENLPNMFRQFDMGILTEEDIVDYFQKYDGINLTPEELWKEIDTYLRIDYSLVDIIKKLKQNGFKVILLSNANNSFFERKIYPTFPEFKSLFDDIIISSVVQMVKPDPDIYLHTLEKTSSHPEEVIFIDDSKVNVDAAIKLGMHGFIYTESTSFVKYLESLGIVLAK